MSIFRNGLVTPTIITAIFLTTTGAFTAAQAAPQTLPKNSIAEQASDESLSLIKSLGYDVETPRIIVLNAEGQELDIDGNVKVAPPEPAPETPQAAPEPVLASNAVQATQQVNTAPITASSVLEAARAQIGQNQDCTALVERALRAVGVNIGDVGPMGFANIGTQVSPADAQAGDIMMRSGHAAVYAGNGVAVHGGFNGNSTVESSVDANPYSYSVIVRI